MYLAKHHQLMCNCIDHAQAFLAPTIEIGEAKSDKSKALNSIACRLPFYFARRLYLLIYAVNGANDAGAG